MNQFLRPATDIPQIMRPVMVNWVGPHKVARRPWAPKTFLDFVIGNDFNKQPVPLKRAGSTVCIALWNGHSVASCSIVERNMRQWPDTSFWDLRLISLTNLTTAANIIHSNACACHQYTSRQRRRWFIKTQKTFTCRRYEDGDERYACQSIGSCSQDIFAQISIFITFGNARLRFPVLLFCLRTRRRAWER